MVAGESGVGSEKTEVGCRKTEVGRRKTEDGCASLLKNIIS